MAQVKKWQFDLSGLQTSTQITSRRNSNDKSYDPVGYSKTIATQFVNDGKSGQQSDALSCDAEKTIPLKQKRAMEIAYAPGKSLFMTAFMMYMSGSSVQIFSIMITGMALFTPIRSLLAINNAFMSVSDPKVNLIQAKVVYTLMNLLGLTMAVYKCGTMGLLPTTSADWAWLLAIPQSIEVSTEAISLTG